jgi:carboxypeptidase Ss1
MGSEDFSWYEHGTPGVFFNIGTKNKAKGCIYDNHNSKFKVDEDVLKYGSVGLATIAFELTDSKLP